MRNTSQALVNAIEQPIAYSMRAKLILQKSRIYFDSVESDYHPSFAESYGWINNAIMTDIVYSATNIELVTFYNHDNSLEYTISGVNTAVAVTSGGIYGKPGTIGNYLYKINTNGNLSRFSLDYSAIHNLSSSILSAESIIATPSSNNGSVHAISDTEVVYVMPDDGGIRPVVYAYTEGSWVEHAHSCRFMFPTQTESSGSIGLSISQITNFSGAAKLNDKIFIYQSNLLTGTVEGVFYDTSRNDWSDIFVAVPTDLSVSLCEFRVAKCYVVDGAVYMAGQFRRTDSEAERPYSLILSSDDGKTFSLNRFSLVSIEGYRFQALVHQNNLYVAHCNRVSSSPVTHYFSHTSGSSGYSFEVYTAPDIINISSTSSESASFRIAAGNNALLDSGYAEEGNRVILYLGYLTSGSTPEFIEYGTYYIDNIDFEFSNGLQGASLNCINASSWLLSDLTSPFYTEIISKSSLYTDNLDSSYWTEAINSGLSENTLSVDFWNAEGYAASGITAVEISSSGGIEEFYSSGNHTLGISTGDLDYLLGSSEFPTCTSGSVHLKIYGWSFSEANNNVNDTVACRLIMQSSGSSPTEYIVEVGGSRFPNTWPEGYEQSGYFPIEYDIAVTSGDKIKQIVLVFSSANATSFYPQRVEITSGINVFYPYKTGALWDFTSGSGAEIPGKLRPYLMTATRPYNAWNFQIAAKFSNTVTGSISGFQSSAGLAGLIYDGSNYVVARYDKVSQNLELVKVRDRTETILTSGSTSFSVLDTFEMMFMHKDGLFNVYMKNSGAWELQLSYAWKATDGFMVKDLISSIDVGVYGFIDTPYFRTSGYDNTTDEEKTNAIGIPILPGYQEFSSFPSSGKVDIDDNIYNYDGKLSCNPIRGPSQFRNNAKWWMPFGNGPALECLDMDWTKSAGYLAGYWAALDDGGVYTIVDTLWQPWITTGGVVIELPGRSRFYGTEVLSTSVHSLSNRVYITGGLGNVTVAKGEGTTHQWGSDVIYHVEGTIYCHWFYGSSGDYDATVCDLIDRTCKISGATSIFPGDIVTQSQSINGTYTAGSLTYVDGYDLYFDIDLSSGEWLKIATESSVTTELGQDSISAIRISCVSGSTYNVEFLLDSTNTVVESFPFTLNGKGRFRILYHDNFATVYVNDRWIFTFCPKSIDYADTINVNIVSGQGSLFENIRLTELCDWREAVYIDLETDGKSAISSIVQERPIEIYAKSDGSISYWYVPNRSSISQITDHIRGHRVTRSIPKGSSSDAIVYYSEVSTINNEDYAALYGFATKVFRMPSLTTGATKAARIAQQREYEKGKMHSLIIRPDIRLEVGDILVVSYSAVGSGRSYSFSIVIEGIQLDMAGEAARSSMQVTGRSI